MKTPHFLFPYRVEMMASFMFLLAGCQGSPVHPPAAPAPVAAAYGPIRFSDRAEEAGIAFRLGHNGKSPLNILETAGCGCGFLDFDGDGKLDIILIGQPRCALYRNRGDGTFEDVSLRWGVAAEGTFMGVAVGDFNNDARPDMLITGYGRNILYRNRGDRFEDVTKAAHLSARNPYDWATSATFADFDGDGNLDVALGHYIEFTPQSLQTCAYSGVQAACPPFYYEAQHLQVFRGDGQGGFRDATHEWGMSGGGGNNLGVMAADFDGDGRQDLYVANDGLPANLYLNRPIKSQTHFEEVGKISGTAYNEQGGPQAGMGVDAGDYDNDGLLDLLVTTFQDEPKALYRNEGGGQFRFASFAVGVGNATLNRLGFGVAFADFDGDGKTDILTANGHVQDTVERFRSPAKYRQTMQCFRNQSPSQGGEVRFQEVTAQAGEPFAREIVGRGLAIGDFDNDGRPDALVVDLEGRPLLLHNESAIQEWLGMRLLTAKGNRDALGAIITLTAGGVSQTRLAQTGRSYLSASDARVLFGMGARAKPESAVVRWPDGRKERFPLSSVAMNQYITRREGTSKTQ